MTSPSRPHPHRRIASHDRTATLLLRLGVSAGWLKPGQPLPPLRSFGVQVSMNSRLLTGGPRSIEANASPCAEPRERLEVLCMQFMGHAARHGFSPNDTYRSIQALLEKELTDGTHHEF